MPELPEASSIPKTSPPPAMIVRNLCVTAGKRLIVRNITLDIPEREVFCIIGPSGAGKSTLLKCLNRMVDLSPGLRISGDVLFNGQSIYARSVRADELRARIGILFQQPVIFPKSIYQNVIFGLRHLHQAPRRTWREVAEMALREAALWDEVKDRLGEPAIKLSVGQQQRLCLARTLACKPQVILMDEPTSALDPRATQQIEELIVRLKERHTVVLVTHNLAQARQVADRIVRFEVNDGVGELAASTEIEAAAHSLASAV